MPTPATTIDASNNVPTLSDVMDKLTSLEKKILPTPQKRPREEQPALIRNNAPFVHDNNTHTGTVSAAKKSWLDVTLTEKVTDQDGYIVESSLKRLLLMLTTRP
jgi:hypothetical protein